MNHWPKTPNAIIPILSKTHIPRVVASRIMQLSQHGTTPPLTPNFFGEDSGAPVAPAEATKTFWLELRFSALGYIHFAVRFFSVGRFEVSLRFRFRASWFG